MIIFFFFFFFPSSSYRLYFMHKTNMEARTTFFTLSNVLPII